MRSLLSFERCLAPFVLKGKIVVGAQTEGAISFLSEESFIFSPHVVYRFVRDS